MKEIKEICTKIVSNWYSIDSNLSLEFNFLDDIKGESTILINNNDATISKRNYSIGTMPSIDSHGNYQFYLHIDAFPEIMYFLILHLDNKTMILKYMKSFDTIGEEIVFKRVTKSADDILSTIK